MSIQDDLMRLIDPLCLIIIAASPQRAICGCDTLPHLFRRRDLTQIAFLKSITAGV